MTKTGEDFGFYGILTRPRVGYEALAAIMVDAGVRYIQLRMKEEPQEEVLKMARRIRAIIRGESLFIVNDYPDIARRVGADGVHLGQEDMTPSAARVLLGENAIIGISTHNPAQTRAACQLAPNYIGVGPVFATPTKKIPDPVLGLDGMRRMLDLATVPAVAIGGIAPHNMGDIINAGARNLCAVRSLNSAENPAVVLREMMSRISSGNQQ